MPSDPLLDHEYDGIRELDNAAPRWLMLILHGSIVWSLLYVAWYHGIGAALGPTAWEREGQEIAQRRAAAAGGGPITDEALLRELSHDGARIARGHELFARSACPQCHGADGTGRMGAAMLPGPNLRDDWWLHGSGMLAIVATITDGRPDKGMPPQRDIFSHDDILNLACFVADWSRGAKAEGNPPDRARATLAPVGY